MRISDACQERMRQVWAASVPRPYRPQLLNRDGHPRKQQNPDRGCIVMQLPADATLTLFWRDVLNQLRE